MNWFTRLFYPTHDPAWKPTGLRKCFTGHDESRVILSTKPVKAAVYVLPKREAK